MRFSPLAAVACLLLAIGCLWMASPTEQRATANSTETPSIKQELASVDDALKQATIALAQQGAINEKMMNLDKQLTDRLFLLEDRLSKVRLQLEQDFETTVKLVSATSDKIEAVEQKAKAEIGECDCDCGEKLAIMQGTLDALKLRVTELEAKCYGSYGTSSSAATVKSGGSTGSVKSGGSTGSVTSSGYGSTGSTVRPVYSAPIYSEPVYSSVPMSAPGSDCYIDASGNVRCPSRMPTTSNRQVRRSGLLGLGWFGR